VTDDIIESLLQEVTDDIIESLLQEVTDDIIESSQCRQVMTQLVELPTNSGSLQQCSDDLRHTVNVSKILADILLLGIWSRL